VRRVTTDEVYTNYLLPGYIALIAVVLVVTWLSIKIRHHQREIEAIKRRADSQDAAWRMGDDAWGARGEIEGRYWQA